MLLVLLLILSSCSPDFFKTAEDVLTNDAITVKVDKDAFQKDTDVEVNVKVMKKDALPAK